MACLFFTGPAPASQAPAAPKGELDFLADGMTHQQNQPTDNGFGDGNAAGGYGMPNGDAAGYQQQQQYGNGYDQQPGYGMGPPDMGYGMNPFGTAPGGYGPPVNSLAIVPVGELTTVHRAVGCCMLALCCKALVVVSSKAPC